MSRLTGHNEQGGIVSLVEGVHPDVERMRLLQAVCAYEDAEEQGLLVRVPGPEGTEFYTIDDGQVLRCKMLETEVFYAHEYLDEDYPIAGGFTGADIRELKAFAAREEAEAALEKEGRE